MAEANYDKTTTHRRQHQQNGPSYSNRGRGGLDPRVSKAIHNFGVSDLGELLDRKYQDERQCKSRPPPEPSYSFLKDPWRENANCDNSCRSYYKAADSWSRGHGTRGYRGRGGMKRDNKYHQLESTSLIENPINIKIALTTSTGERSCKLDEETKLVDIKYVSNRKPQGRRLFKGDGRGRGERGRGREERGRGRYEGGDMRNEFRGSGSRQIGRDRDQGKYNFRTLNRTNHHHSDNKVNTNEDNWDIECSNSHPEQNKNVAKKNEENIKKVYKKTSEECEPEEYYEHSEAVEINLLQRKIEENLVITSSVPEKNEDDGKRTVKFKVVDKKDNAAQLEQVADRKDIKPEQKVQAED